MSVKQVVCGHSNKPFTYEIVTGFDAELLIDMHDKWSVEKNKIVNEILAKTPAAVRDRALFAQLLGENNLEDFGWDWLAKAHFLKTDEYDWFYLKADGAVQAACIIFHPKASRIDQQQIFYVDYLATAFWNRPRPNYDKRFSGLGSILISHGIRHSMEVLGYRPGFCLHSLPKAEPFYMRLGMKDFGKDPSKENLTYFEADQDVSRKLLEAANDEA